MTGNCFVEKCYAPMLLLDIRYHWLDKMIATFLFSLNVSVPIDTRVSMFSNGTSRKILAVIIIK